MEGFDDCAALVPFNEPIPLFFPTVPGLEPTTPQLKNGQGKLFRGGRKQIQGRTLMSSGRLLFGVGGRSFFPSCALGLARRGMIRFWLFRMFGIYLDGTNSFCKLRLAGDDALCRQNAL